MTDLQVALLVCGLTLATERAGVLAAQPSAADTWALVVPMRRAPDTPPAPPPGLPTGADQIVPLTVTTIVRRQPTSGGTRTLQQTISRTADRIHIAARNGREWLFVRNRRDPRRASAWLIEHASRAIVLYEESDLRMTAGIRGWADVLGLGFDMDVLKDVNRAPQSQSIGPVRFARYATHSANSSTREVWWSERHILPMRFTTADQGGSTRLSIESIRTGANAALLQPPETRFPTYQVFDVAEWLERR